MGGLFKSSRRSEAATTILIVIIVVFFIGWLVNIGQRECRTNKDCGSESYCGSDFACHKYPTIQKTIVQYNLLAPSKIIATAIIIEGAKRLYCTIVFCIVGYWWHAKSLPQYDSEQQSLLVLHSLWFILKIHPIKKTAISTISIV